MTKKQALLLQYLVRTRNEIKFPETPIITNICHNHGTGNFFVQIYGDHRLQVLPIIQFYDWSFYVTNENTLIIT